MNIELLGNYMIPQDQVGCYLCTIHNGFNLRWTVDTGSVVFHGFQESGEQGNFATNRFNISAILLSRNVADNNPNQRGTRISVLCFMPDLNFTDSVNITCMSDGLVNGTCTMMVHITGNTTTHIC